MSKFLVVPELFDAHAYSRINLNFQTLSCLFFESMLHRGFKLHLKELLKKDFCQNSTMMELYFKAPKQQTLKNNIIYLC